MTLFVRGRHRLAVLELNPYDNYLRPDLEEELAARALADGLSTEEFVNRELERLVASPQSGSELSSEERVRLWREFVTRYSVGGTPLSDYAVSRESIYTREDEML